MTIELSRHLPWIEQQLTIHGRTSVTCYVRFMSIVIERILICDGKNCQYDGSYAGGDQRNKSSTMLRQNSKEDGWINVGNKDYCPLCTAKRKEHITQK